ncbi:unnamed protein product [Hymenolepis diminuta]|uniref:Uncharacterized protein n=1 Tax=Hymenolepis diminuta TaxID=6216 RepID=A0A564XYN0_HYMDI|nr:unnamed protein product [Hymenolepis diminuta]
MWVNMVMLEELYNRAGKRMGREIFQTRSPHHQGGHVAKCNFAEIVLREITFVMSVERKDERKGKKGSETNDHLKRETAGKPTGLFASFTVVSSTYESRSSNLR